MSSERRILSSRANGAKSRGPVTDEGKARACANNIRHGVLASTVVLDGEDPSEFVALLTSFEAEFNPITTTEQSLVESLAISRWRIMRLWGVEKATMSDEIEKQLTSLPSRRTGRAFKAICDQSHLLDLIARYETRFERQYNRCLRLLRHRRDSNISILPFEPSLENEHFEQPSLDEAA